MAGALLTLDLDARAAIGQAASAGAALRDPAALLRELGEMLLPIHRRRFTAQQSPDGTPWAALSPAYQRRKKRNKNRILVLNNYLAGTLRWQIQGSDLLFGTDRKYGRIHQFGGTIKHAARESTVYFRQARDGSIGNRFVRANKSNFAQSVSIGAHETTIPARPWLGIGREDALRLERTARDHVARALNRGTA